MNKWLIRAANLVKIFVPNNSFRIKMVLRFTKGIIITWFLPHSQIFSQRKGPRARIVYHLLCNFAPTIASCR